MGIGYMPPGGGSDNTKVAKTGDTMTNHLLFSTTAAIPASFGIGNNSGFGLCLFAPTGWYVSTFVNQSEKLRVTDSAVQANVKLEFNSAADPPTHGIGPNGSGNLVVNGSGNLKLRRNGVDHFECYGGLLLAYYSIQYQASATPTSTAYEDGYNSTIGAYKNAPAAGSARICTAGGGTTKSEVAVYGASHSNKKGMVAIKSEGIARANTGTWVPIYSLSDGVHTGEFHLQAYNGTFHASRSTYPVEGTTLNTVQNGASNDWSFVDSGSAGASNISLRINSGNLEIWVGSSVEADVEFGLIFIGMVN